MLNYKKSSTLIFCLCLMLSWPAQAVSQTCLSAEQYPDDWPASRYEDHNNGTVTDTKTGLMWKVCSEGEVFNFYACTTSSYACIERHSCTGTVSSHTWQSALALATTFNSGGGYASYKDWRVPNVVELSSLVKWNCSRPSLNQFVFTDTFGSKYWSSSPSPDPSFSAYAWGVGFEHGQDFNDYRSQTNFVRLVRSGQ